MENTTNTARQNLFHTRIIDPLLNQGASPAAGLALLGDWSKQVRELDKADKPAQHNAFIKSIMVDLLGYKPASGDAAYTLEDLATGQSYFDAAVGQFDKAGKRVVALLKLMGPNVSLDAISEDERLSLIQLGRHYAKETEEAQFFILSNLNEIRVYSLLHKRNTYERFVLDEMAEKPESYQRLMLLLGAENLVSGKTAGWLHESVAAGLDDKFAQPQHATIRDVYGPLKPGVNIEVPEAFVIDKKKYDQLIAEDPKSTEILKPYFAGDDLTRWHSESPVHWLIYTPRGKVDIDSYPAIKKHLEAYRDTLEKRAGDQAWFELDHSGPTDLPASTELRLGIGRLQETPGFVIGNQDTHYNQDSYYFGNADYYVFGLLNSSAINKLIRSRAQQIEGKYEMLVDLIESLPVPDADGERRAQIGQLATFCHEVAQDRRDMIRYFRGMTAFNLSPEKLAAKLSPRLLNWYDHDFDTFRSEVIASFGVDIPSDQLQTWTAFFEQKRKDIDNVSSDLFVGQRDLDVIVYHLFGFDADEIALIEAD